MASGRELHLHSMIVHAVIALAIVAAAAFALEVAQRPLGPVGVAAWAWLWRAALVALLLVALPATLTGVTERAHMYVNWHPSHRAKLILSLLLVALVVAELAAVARGAGAATVASGLGLAVVVANPLVCVALSYWGLRITLGRQSLAPVSYVPDMVKNPPEDVLAAAAQHVADRARVIEVLEEHQP